MRSASSFLLILSVICGVNACTDKEEAVYFPPSPSVKYAALAVGSGIDSLPLDASVAAKQIPNQTTASNWDISWSCVITPDGAELPTIYQSESLSAKATGLAEGIYVFEVKFSTRRGSKRQIMVVEVVPDKPAGTQIILHDLKWELSTISNGVIPGPYYAIASLHNRPDLIFYRGEKRYPKVEYLDPKSNTWIMVRSHSDLPPSNTALELVPGAYLDFVTQQSYIAVLEGIDADWLKNANPAVRLTY